MTLFKKSLALLLALTMIFSTMSVMGYAADESGIRYYTHMNADGTIGTHNGNNGFEFVVKFYRWAVTDDKGTPETADDVYGWIETDRAKPGEDVQARVFVGTEYPVYSNIFAATTFDSKYLTAKNSGTYDLVVNPSHSSGLSIGGIQGGSVHDNPYNQNRLRLTNKKSFFNKPGKVTDGSGNVISESYYLPLDYFYGEGAESEKIVKGLVTANAQLSGTSIGATPFNVNDWVYAIDFTVKNDEYVKTPGNKGYVEVPLELANQKTINAESNAMGLTEIPKFALGSVDTQFGSQSLIDFDAYGKTTPGYISVFSNVTFDAVAEEGGYFAGGATTETVSGVIGESVDDSSLTIANSAGKQFVGWSLTKGGEVIDDDFTIGYEDITLYAVWEESEVKTYYTYEIYQMKEDGTYPAKPFSQQFYHASGEDVSIKGTDAPEGFYLDTTKENVLSGVVSANNSTVLRAYFARNQYTVTYHYTDNNGPQEEESKVYHGQVLPEFDAVEGGKPVVPGKEFIGWSQSENENIAPPVVMPMNDVDLYPIYKDIIYTYVYDANGGKFTDGEVIKSFVYKYGETPEDFAEIPVMAGHEFSCWDIEAPATVTEDLTFKAEYETNNYTVKFVDSTGKTLYEDTFKYGEEITEDYIPDGYKADAWTFADGVKAEFPFTLEDNVVLTASEDANIYKVTFLVDGEIYKEYEIASGSEVIVPDKNPEDKIGFKFTMWDPSPDGQFVDEEDLVFEAIFVKGEYTLSFDTDGGSTIDAITALYGDSIADKLPGENATTKEGYTFIGWDTKLPETMPGENTVVKALWAKNVYGVKFVNGLTGAEITTVTGVFGATVNAPALPEAAGYTFAWDVTPPTTIPAKNENGEVMDNGGVMTVTAVPTANDVTIAFDTNGGSPVEMPMIGGKANEEIEPAITEPTPPEGMYFAGWDDGTGNVIETPVKFPAESVKLLAVYKNNFYDAIYDADGGKFADGTTADKTFSVEYGAEVPAPAAPTKDGFEFAGWSPVVTTMPAKSVTFTAQWKTAGAVDYTITVYAVNPATGEYLAPIVYNWKADNGTKLEIREKGSGVPDGVLVIWYEDLYESSTNVPDADNANNVLELTVDRDGENNLVAYFKLQTYSLVFEANGGEFTDAPAGDSRYSENRYTVTGTAGETVELPVEPKRDGYDFKGWRDGETDTLYTESVPAIAGDVDYTAEWEKKTYDVTFTITDEEGETIFEETVTFEHDEEVVAPDYDLPGGYEFDGWEIPKGTVGQNAGDYSSEADLKSYDVKYVAVTGVPAGVTLPADATAEHKATIDVADVTVPDGYTFDGWYINGMDGAKAGSTYTIDAASVTFYGKFTANTYNINYDVAGGDYLASTPVVFGAPVTNITVPTKEGYTFAGWVDVQGNAVTDATGKVLDESFTMPAEDILLKATWDKNPTYHNVIYSYNIAGIAEVPATETNIQAGTVHTLATAPADTAEYAFTGWYYNGVKVTSVTMPAEDVYVIGIWEAIIPDTFKLTLDANGGEFADGTTENVSYHEEDADISSLNSLVPEREGYTFTGWGDAALTVMPGEDTVVKANWEIEKYTIIFETDGGTAIDPMEVTYGQTVVAPANPTKDGFEFIKWSPALPTTMGDIGDNGATITVTAIWAEVDTRNNLVADANGGTYADGTSIKNHKFNAGDVVDGAIEEPTREGYEFDGWDGLDEGGKMPEGDTTITAKWIAKVTIDPNGGKFADGTTDKIVTEADSIDVAGKLPVTKERAELIGWKDTFTGTIYDEIPATSDVALNLVAQWDDEEQYTITFYVGSNVHKTDAYYEGEAIVLPEAPTVTGFDFGGWTLKDGTEVPATMGTENLEAIAVLNPHKHNVTFYLDDAKTVVYKEYTDVAFGSEIEVPADPTHPTNPELVFAGWNPTVESEMPDKDLEYVATWTEVGESFTAHFVADGNTHRLFVLKEGDAIPEVPDPKKFGYKFVGWEPEVPETMPGESIVFEAQWEIDKTFASIIIGGTVIGGGAIAGLIGTGAVIGGSIIGGILVIWGGVELAKNTFTVTYKVDGEVYKTYKVIAGTKVPVPADPTKDGKEFAGWNPEVPEKMPKENLVFEAEWKSATDVEIPSTGSASGLAALAAISAAGAIAILASRKKKDEDEE